MEGCCKASRLTMPPLPGSNVSCQSPWAFLPPNPNGFARQKKIPAGSMFKDSIMAITVWRRQPMLNCSELGLLGKRAAPILLFAGCHDLSQSCSGLQPFPDSSNPCLPKPIPHLPPAYILPSHPETGGLFEKRSLNWMCLAAGPAGWVWVWGMRLRTLVSGGLGGQVGFEECWM